MKIQENLENYLTKQENIFVFLISLAIIIAIGAIDYFTGSKLSVSTLYVIPIFLAAWHCGLKWGILASSMSVIAWFTADILARTQPFYLSMVLWNALARFTTFLIVTYALWLVRVARKRNEELIDFVVHDLRSPATIIKEGLSQLRADLDAKLSDRQKTLLARKIWPGSSSTDLPRSGQKRWVLILEAAWD